MTVANEGPNISLGGMELYVETVTSAASANKGASRRLYSARNVGMVSTQNGTTKLGAKVSLYRPELMAMLAEGL